MTEPRAYTPEEGRALFIDHVASIFRYWMRDADIKSKPADRPEGEWRAEGFLFSLLVMFDGGSMAMPAFDIVPAPHPDDEAYHRKAGENWWSLEPINDTQLHEIFPWEKLRG